MTMTQQQKSDSVPNLSTRLIVAISLMLCLWSWHTWAVTINSADLALVCPYAGESLDGWHPPDFSASHCQTEAIKLINPQQQLLWVKIDLENSAKQQQNKPLGLFISGKTSSKVYLNGELMGSNGHPAKDKQSEVPGLMDAVFHLSKESLKNRGNTVVLLLSAHHGFLSVGQPINNISIGPYNRLTDHILRYYWPSFLPFGVLLLGFFYLSLLAWMNQLPRHTWLLPLMALLAAAQLFVEVYRGLVAYPYPLHDVRLLLILFCSLGFGLSLLAYVISMIQLKNKFWHVLTLFGLSVLLVIWMPGFDRKSILAILLPVVIAAGYALRGWLQAQKHLGFVTVLLLVFALLIVITAYSFIDTVYYYLVAGLIFMLMTHQAKEASRIKQLQLQDQERANRLQQIIDQQAFKHNTDQLKIKSAGKVEWLNITDIAYCKGAGDYVELVLLDGQVKLFHGSITELTVRLPSTFLKTHRSYLVNTTLIESLQRSASGAGQLYLSQGGVVPVSRRILPQVREQLS